MKTNGKNPATKGLATAKAGAAKKIGAKSAVTKKAVAKRTLGKSAPKKKATAPVLMPPVSVPLLPSTSDVLNRLFAVITERRTADPAVSHSARLLSRGMPKVAQKFGEEAVECLIEALEGNEEALVAESADVLYHLLVLWVAAGLEPDQVWAELARREGVSGVAEKAARPSLLATRKIP